MNSLIKAKLEKLGYEAKIQDGCVIFHIQKFLCVIVHDPDYKEFTLSCVVCTLNEVPEDQALEFTLHLLKLNSSIKPFAFALNPIEDDEGILINLIDSFNSQDDLEWNVESLRKALVATASELKGFLKETVQ